MSAEDNSSAEPADIGEALVAALGFEPAEGRKRTRRSGSSKPNDAAGDGFSILAADTGGSATGPAELDNVAGSADLQTDASGGNGSVSATTATRNRSSDSRKSKKRRNRSTPAGSGPANSAESRGANARGSANGPESGGSGQSALDDNIKSAAKPIVSTTPNARTGSPVTTADGTVVLPGTENGADPSPASEPGAEAIRSGNGPADAEQAAAGVTGNGSNRPGQSSDGSGRSDGAAADSVDNGSSGTARSADRSSANSLSADPAMAEAAAVTGELLDIIDRPEDQPPPPSAADAIQVTTSEEESAGADALATVPTAPPSMPPGPVSADVATADSSAVSSGPATGAASAGQREATQRIDTMPDPVTAAGPRADARPSSADALPSRADALPSRADALPSRADALPSRADDPQAKLDPAEAKLDMVPAAPQQPLELVGDERLDPTAKLATAPARPAPGFDLSTLPNVFRRKRRVQARKVRRVIRHIDPWSVLTFSVLFHLCVFAALLLASVLVWNAADAAGTIENMEAFILELGDYETFEIKGEVVFRAAVAIAGILTLASSVLLVLLTVVFNLISDLVGGIRLTVIEEETVRVRRKKNS